MIKRELNLLFLTFQYYSRIPTPRAEYSEEGLSKAFRYFPLVGAVVGGIGGGVFWLLNFVLPHEVAVFFALIAMTWTSGAIHEDGFSDTFDGFGGGYDRERILAIMRDSSSGVFGITALILLFGLKFLLLKNLPADMVPAALISAQASARIMPLFFINSADYARHDVSKGMHTRKKLSPATFGIALFFSLLSLCLIPWQTAVGIVLLYAVVYFCIRRMAIRKIGGYTGDVLGALIVTCEVSFYTLLLVGIPCF